ncbi:MAG: MBL fold metallo-hydrolase [Candidatus Harrisonbacteria bacterium CG10_big_fil_rev_8_21_14_0_10_42_17]|uniref:MBL fold metallo-hydrolase n=1 Tax=Candidatus Harrisonbacteria bacterium CG10_big_fil_rev_8_21_14_0_10_42_17 TaxID=1974584 RepID=A0A2M6WI95_9BACT|nr:MAG: MBL fold metallo-hydrolase [Candidatus Harrisonbacteria bacterium CG10_big_fil_rev_8_21_14_0_10_42_17]
MKHIVIALILVAFGVGVFLFLPQDSQKAVEFKDTSSDTMIKKDDIIVTPISHASAVLDWGGTIIYSDPVGGAEAFLGQPKPDIVFITHEHADHFDVVTLNAVLVDSTKLIVPQSVVDKLPEDFSHPVTILSNGEITTYQDFTIEAVPAYNIREEALSNHPGGRDNGYVIEHSGKRVYFSGDSEDTPEMRVLQNIDIAFVAMNLPYTMSVESAADAVLAFVPKQVYPYHYRTPGGFSDVARFKTLVNRGNPEIAVIQRVWYPDLEM